jgi:hypothetical protein
MDVEQKVLGGGGASFPALLYKKDIILMMNEKTSL